MKKLMTGAAILLSFSALSEASELKDPCGSPKEFYSKYLLDKCYKVYFDAISEASRNAKAAIDKTNKLEAIINDHEKRISALEKRPVQKPAEKPTVVQQEKPTVVVQPYTWELEELGTIRFDVNRFNIRKDQAQVLKEIVDKAKESGKEILVVGFADKAGSPKYNFSLSMWRAQSTASELAKQGISIARIRMAAYGKEVHDLLNPEDRRDQRVVKVYIVK